MKAVALMVSTLLSYQTGTVVNFGGRISNDAANTTMMQVF